MHRWYRSLYFRNSGPLNNFFIKEIIPETNGHDTDKLNVTINSFWALFNSDVAEEIRCDNETSSDSYTSNSKVVSKTAQVPIKHCFNNPSVGQSSKPSSDSRNKPWLNKKNIVHPKIKARKPLEKETRSTQCSRFLEISEKSASNSQSNY